MGARTFIERIGVDEIRGGFAQTPQELVCFL